MQRIAFAAALTLVAACRGEEVKNGWERARLALTNGNECFAARADYCITDPEFVDGAIKARLNDLYGGVMPTRPDRVKSVVKWGITQYRRESMRPENVAKITELVRERYGQPAITWNEDEVTFDVGVVPGVIETVPATLSLTMVFSEYAPREGGLLSREAVRLLQTYDNKTYQDASALRLVVSVPAGHDQKVWVYRLLKKDRRIVVYSETGAAFSTARWTGDSPDFEKLSLAIGDLSFCKVDKEKSPTSVGLPLLECPPDAPLRAKTR